MKKPSKLINAKVKKLKKGAKILGQEWDSERMFEAYIAEILNYLDEKENNAK